MINVLVVDDHCIMRSGLVHLLETTADLRVAAEAGTGQEAVELAGKLEPDVVLLDMNLPDMDGLEATAQIMARQPRCGVLILTMYESHDLARRALKVGALGYVVKATEPDELIEAIRSVALRRPYVTPSLRDRIILDHVGAGAVADPLGSLSNRERQILVELAAGHNVQDMADKLCLSASTVKTYKARIQDKLGLRSLADLVRFAVRQGLIDPY